MVATYSENNGWHKLQLRQVATDTASYPVIQLRKHLPCHVKTTCRKSALISQSTLAVAHHRSQQSLQLFDLSKKLETGVLSVGPCAPLPATIR